MQEKALFADAFQSQPFILARLMREFLEASSEFRDNPKAYIVTAFKGDGIGTSLLVAAVQSLRTAGYRRLLTTFIAGNDSSMLWHWRNGFQLAPYFASKRRFRRNVNAGSTPVVAADSESDHP